MAVPPTGRGPAPRRARASRGRAVRRGPAAGAGGSRRPAGATFYGRVLRLERTSLPWWLRATYVEGAVVVGFVLYLADAASAWVMLALPVAIAVLVKVYDAALAPAAERTTAPAGPLAEQTTASAPAAERTTASAPAGGRATADPVSTAEEPTTVLPAAGRRARRGPEAEGVRPIRVGAPTDGSRASGPAPRPTPRRPTPH